MPVVIGGNENEKERKSNIKLMRIVIRKKTNK